jgi:hypothetical protein
MWGKHEEEKNKIIPTEKILCIMKIFSEEMEERNLQKNGISC